MSAGRISQCLKLFHLWIPFSILVLLVSRILPEGGSIYSLFTPISKNPECMMRQTTGLSCGSCGMTSAFHSIMHGDFTLALLRHPLSLPLFMGILALGFIAVADIFNWDTLSAPWFRFFKNNGRSFVLEIILVFAAIYIARIIGELETGYLKPGGLHKLLFFWFYLVNGAYFNSPS